MAYAIVPASGHSGNSTRVISVHKTLSAARKKKGNYQRWQIIEADGLRKGQTFYMDTVGSVYRRANSARGNSKKNPARAVSLKNFTGTITKLPNGQVLVRGRKK